jgi:hypothetical protein
MKKITLLLSQAVMSGLLMLIFFLIFFRFCVHIKNFHVLLSITNNTIYFNRMKKITIMILWGLLATLPSCDVAQQVMRTYNMTQCKYEYKSISGLTLAGVNLHNVSNISSINPLSLTSLLGAFMSPEGSLPLDFTLNIDVTNPGLQTALLNGMAYILEIDGIEMTQGSLSQRIQIASGGKSVLPIRMSFDLKKVLSGKSMDSIKNLAFNFAGIGNEASNVTIRLKPSFIIGSQTIIAPSYIPVSFTLKK